MLIVFGCSLMSKSICRTAGPRTTILLVARRLEAHRRSRNSLGSLAASEVRRFRWRQTSKNHEMCRSSGCGSHRTLVHRGHLSGRVWARGCNRSGLEPCHGCSTRLHRIGSQWRATVRAVLPARAERPARCLTCKSHTRCPDQLWNCCFRFMG